MQRLPMAAIAVCILSFTLRAAAHEGPHTEVAAGVVYHDANENGKFDEGERPLPKIKVSNGRQIAATDESGRYELPVGEDTIVFVLKPRGWRTPIDAEMKLPRFYYIHKPHGSPESKFPGVAPTGPLPESVDFPLYPQEEPEQFRAVLFGDPQPRDEKEVDYIGHDVVEELIGTDASFGVTLGDIAFDDLSTFEPLSKTIALIGIPWYNVIGNHDINYEARHDHHSDETFERVFGPPYYSFDHGPVHFLVLDDIEWYIPEEGGRGRYRGGFGAAQMEFIKNDLARIPERQLVVLMMHIPLTDVRDRHELYRLIEQRPFCVSISGHTHHHEHRYIKREDGWEGPEPHHHIINVTVSGSWWSGAPDDRGLPHTMMACGAPNGYSIISFDGTEYALDFRAAGRSADYQMNIFAPENVAAASLAATSVYANVFNGSEKSEVFMRVDRSGEWLEMKRSIQVDPLYQAIVDAEAKVSGKTWRDLPRPKPSPHLWKATLPQGLAPGTHLIEVRAANSNERTFQGRRVIEVTE